MEDERALFISTLVSTVLTLRDRMDSVMHGTEPEVLTEKGQSISKIKTQPMFMGFHQYNISKCPSTLWKLSPLSRAL